MKIQGSNPLINAYKNQFHHQKEVKKNQMQSDRLDISLEAKELHGKDGEHNMERVKYVEQIKDRVQSGEYKIDYERTAKKMIAFWSNRF